jgi:hypothetical protein
MMPHVIKEVQEYVASEYGEEQRPVVSGEINFPFAVSKFDLLDFEKKKKHE